MSFCTIRKNQKLFLNGRLAYMAMCKKIRHTPLESVHVGGCSSPSPRPWAHRW